MATVRNIVDRSLRKMGIRQPDSTRLAEALDCFNDMLSSWDKDMIIPTTESFTLVAGTSSYTIGSGGTFDTVRPIQLLSAFIRDSDNYDYPVDIYMSRDDYDKYSQKDTDGRPSRLLYTLSYPLGVIQFESEPESAETFYLTSYKPFSPYTALTDTITQPIEYETAMIFNLAVDLASEWNQVLDNTVLERSVILKDQIMNRNSQPVPEVEFPSELLRY